MSYYSPSIEKLIEAFEKLPSIGNKTAARLAFHILDASEEETKKLIEKYSTMSEIEIIKDLSMLSYRMFSSN